MKIITPTKLLLLPIVLFVWFFAVILIGSYGCGYTTETAISIAQRWTAEDIQNLAENPSTFDKSVNFKLMLDPNDFGINPTITIRIVVSLHRNGTCIKEKQQESSVTLSCEDVWFTNVGLNISWQYYRDFLMPIPELGDVIKIEAMMFRPQEEIALDSDYATYTYTQNPYIVSVPYDPQKPITQDLDLNGDPVLFNVWTNFDDAPIGTELFLTMTKLGSSFGTEVGRIRFNTDSDLNFTTFQIGGNWEPGDYSVRATIHDPNWDYFATTDPVLVTINSSAQVDLQEEWLFDKCIAANGHQFDPYIHLDKVNKALNAGKYGISFNTISTQLSPYEETLCIFDNGEEDMFETNAFIDAHNISEDSRYIGAIKNFSQLLGNYQYEIAKWGNYIVGTNIIFIATELESHSQGDYDYTLLHEIGHSIALSYHAPVEPSFEIHSDFCVMWTDLKSEGMHTPYSLYRANDILVDNYANMHYCSLCIDRLRAYVLAQ